MYQKQKKKSIFFEKMVRDHGKDWLTRANPAEYIKYSNMLFRDIAFGSIDKTLYGYAFFNPLFFNAIYGEASNKMIEEKIICDGLSALQEKSDMMANGSAFSVSFDNKFIEIRNKHDILYKIYLIILDMLNSICAEGKLEFLDLAASKLRNVKKVL